MQLQIPRLYDWLGIAHIEIIYVPSIAPAMTSGKLNRETVDKTRLFQTFNSTQHVERLDTVRLQHTNQDMNSQPHTS